MAFEVVFKYYEKINNDYDKSKELEYKKTIGSLENDLPLEKLASVILGQMARRDILVFDVEIYEFTKKKISFKENKNGIVIKNKKFNLGLESILVSEEDEKSNCLLENKFQSERQPCNLPVQQSSVVPMTIPNNIVPMAVPITQSNIASKKPLKDSKPIKTMIFSPTDLKYLKGKPWRFTPNKKYNIYKEKMAPSGVGMIFYAIDDTNREVEVSDEFFISDTINLLNENTEVLKEDVLNWSGTKGFDMPDIRGR